LQSAHDGGRGGDNDYFMTESAKCPTCGREITEDTLVMPRQDEEE